MNKYGENTVLFVTIQSWYIYVLHEKKEDIPSSPKQLVTMGIN